MNNWISVKDRLPDVEDEYICTCSHPNETMVTSLMFDGGHWIEGLQSPLIDNWDCFVTHWMPLPEPAVTKAKPLSQSAWLAQYGRSFVGGSYGLQEESGDD